MIIFFKSINSSAPCCESYFYSLLVEAPFSLILTFWCTGHMFHVGIECNELINLFLFIYSLEDLRQQINSGVNRVDLEESEITIGSLCVAQFSEDDM